MTNEIIFITQVASIIAFIGALFILYRVLVSQKDATIELLKEKIYFLKEQLEVAQKNTPDQLAKKLSERIHIFQEELERLSKDHDANKNQIVKKEKALKKLEEQLVEIQDIASEYFCPYCKARMEVREYHSEPYENGDIDHEYIAFECGYTIVDGREHNICKNKEIR